MKQVEGLRLIEESAAGINADDGILFGFPFSFEMQMEFLDLTSGYET